MKRYKDIFTGKTALITGGARRIGRAVVLELARVGCNVVIHYSASHADAMQTAAEAEAFGVRASVVRSDLSSAEEAEGLMAQVLDSCGNINYLINNASSYNSASLEQMSFNELTESMVVNAYAPLALSRVFAGQKSEGAIINFLDTRIYSYDREHIAYHLSKKALHSLTKMLAYEYAPLLRVNGVAPGIILPPAGLGVEWLEERRQTNVLESYGSVEDITDTVLFLLASEFITGEVICVDGGRHLKNFFYSSFFLSSEFSRSSGV